MQSIPGVVLLNASVIPVRYLYSYIPNFIAKIANVPFALLIVWCICMLI